MRRAMLMVVVVGVMFAGLMPAHAAGPDRGTFDSSESGTDPAGTTCAFPVGYSQREYGSYHFYTDRAGDFARLVLHINYDASIFANGHNLSERDTFTRTIYADGTMRDTGLTEHVQGPNGIVIRDAGQIVYSDTDETVSYVRGPHPFLLGGSFCDALA